MGCKADRRSGKEHESENKREFGEVEECELFLDLV